MPAVLIRQRVLDFAAWIAFVHDHAPNRRANGSLGGHVFLNAEDPAESLMLLEWDDLDRARLFAQSDDFRDAISLTGVASDMELWLLTEAIRLPE
jgi:hypothetical protein